VLSRRCARSFDSTPQRVGVDAADADACGASIQAESAKKAHEQRGREHNAIDIVAEYTS
jgi:hypothetical protein